jgi:hypothetical protein
MQFPGHARLQRIVNQFGLLYQFAQFGSRVFQAMSPSDDRFGFTCAAAALPRGRVGRAGTMALLALPLLLIGP